MHGWWEAGNLVRLMRIVIEGPELSSVDFNEIVEREQSSYSIVVNIKPTCNRRCATVIVYCLSTAVLLHV